MYSTSSLISYEPFVDSVNDRFVKKLRFFAEQGVSFDLYTWFQFYAFDVIGEITMGASFGLLEAGYDKDGLLDAADCANVRYGARVGLVPETHKWLHGLPTTQKKLGAIGTTISRLIEGRKKGQTESDRADFIAKSLSLIQSSKMDPEDMFTVVGQNIGAGSDTTAISATALVYFLMKNPKCLEKLRTEIRDMAERGELSDPVRFQGASKMAYLQAG
jgi:cytochrome P450